MSDDREYRVTVTSVKDEYEYLVLAPSKGSAQQQGKALALQDGWTGFGTVEVRKA